MMHRCGCWPRASAAIVFQCERNDIGRVTQFTDAIRVEPTSKRSSDISRVSDVCAREDMRAHAAANATLCQVVARSQWSAAHKSPHLFGLASFGGTKGPSATFARFQASVAVSPRRVWSAVIASIAIAKSGIRGVVICRGLEGALLWMTWVHCSRTAKLQPAIQAMQN